MLAQRKRIGRSEVCGYQPTLETKRNTNVSFYIVSINFLKYKQVFLKYVQTQGY